MSKIQSVLFPKDISAQDARKWLNDHKLQRIKRADVTTNLRRYRIREPDDEKYVYRIIPLGKGGIRAVIQFDKRKSNKK